MYSGISAAGRDSYQEYLNSPAWFPTRNRALARAGYRCLRCGAKRELQVHHRTYERLGHEWDQDLEVLCRGCHLQTHLRADDEGPLGVYLTFARRAIDQHGYASYADLTAEIGMLCARAHVPSDPVRIAKALGRLLGRAQPMTIRRDRVFIRTPDVVQAPDPPATGAVLLMIRERLIKPWPGSVRTPAEQEEVVLEQARAFHQESYLRDRCRRSIDERLAEIWR